MLNNSLTLNKDKEMNAVTHAITTCDHPVYVYIMQLVIWHTWLSTVGNCVFPVAASCLWKWNSLPCDVTCSLFSEHISKLAFPFISFV